jgi:small-conductance mechanosensitive channel
MIKKVLFGNRLIEVYNTDLYFSGLIFFIAILLSFLLYRIKNKKIVVSGNKVIGYIAFFVLYFLWIGVFISFSFMFFKNFESIQIIKTKHFLLTTIDLIYFAIFPVITILLGKILDYLFKSDSRFFTKELEIKNYTILFVKVILWLFTFEILISTIIKKPGMIGNFVILSFKKFSIAVYDIFGVLIIISLASVILAFFRKMMRRRVDTEKIDSGTAAAIFQILKYLIWVISIVLILQLFGLNLSIILAGSAALLVGLGMGIKDVFNDFVSGLILLIERPLKAGDIVEVDTFVGEVKHIGLRTTTVLSRDDIIILIPNSKFTTEKIINWSNSQEETRFHVDIGVAYGSDIELVMKLLADSVLEHPKISKSHEPLVRFDNFGESSLDFKLFFWSNENLRVEAIKSDIRITISKKFSENNISIPFPQRDLHIIKK